jgi:SP family sugar:H+ symporter-like MFS transporter
MHDDVSPVIATKCFFPTQTKGLSLEQIDLMYQNTLPVNSLAYRARLLAEDIHVSDAAAVEKVTSRREDAHSDEKV